MWMKACRFWAVTGTSTNIRPSGAYRDSRINRIYEGTNEVNRMIIPGELFRRAMKGKLPLMQAAMNLMQEMTNPPAEAPAMPEGPLGVQEYMIGMCKKTAIMVAGLAAQKYQQKLTGEQEVLMRLSDIIIEVFVMETCLLRAQKVLAAKGEKAAKYHIVMVQAYVDDAIPKIETWAKSALAYISAGDTLAGQLSALRKILRYQPIDAISLKRMIADRIIEKDGYPL